MDISGFKWMPQRKKEAVSTSGELPLFQSDLSWERTFSDYENVRFLERKCFAILHAQVSVVWRQGSCDQQSNDQ